MAGTVEKPDGTLARNAYVYLQAWPDGESLGEIEEGASVDAPIIAKTRSTDQGRYELRLEDVSVLSQLASTSGNVDVDVVATDGSATDIAVHSFSLRVGPSEELENADPGDIAQVALSESGPDAGEVRQSATVDVQMVERDEDEVSTLDFANGCPVSGTKYLSSFGKKWVYVGSNYQTGPSGAKGTFRFSKNAESTLGVGISGSGKYGSWSTSGSLKRSSTASVGFGTQGPKTGSHHFTMYTYGKYCTTTRSPGPSFTFSTRATSFAGGADTRSASYPTANHCVRFKKDSDFIKDTTKMTSWASGAKLGSSLGIDLSAQTGFTSTASVKFTFPQAAALCGTKGNPGGNPGRLVARGPGAAG
ncbi:hypothetical protein ACWGIB_23315 [Streptomyces xiamenensis]